MDKKELIPYAERIINALGQKLSRADKEKMLEPFVSNCVQTKKYEVNEIRVDAEVVRFDKTCRIDINFHLPEDGAVAYTFMDFCGEKENIPKNHGGSYTYGPRYRDYSTELSQKITETICCNWDHYFYIRSEHYLFEEIDEAVDNAIALALKFYNHLSEYRQLRFWTTDDEQVKAKAMEILQNADLHETDIDREERAHWLEDRNSFFKGWFSPFNDRGRGTFDTLWPSSVDYAASSMGERGSFEYAVACILLENPEMIQKGKKACRIREEIRKY